MAHEGSPGFAGIWDTTFGRLRVFQSGTRAHGTYDASGESSLRGRARGDRLEFTYREPAARGEGQFALAPDGLSFSGRWRTLPDGDWNEWAGRRLAAEPGVTWLVVLEAHWQRSLAEPEYAFGNMLREVFVRQPGIRVRQRYFHDAASLEHWCREVQYLPEPSLVVIASHGTPRGVTVRGKVIDTARVLRALRPAERLSLLHFSSCLVGQDGDGALGDHAFPVSGYVTRVDWGASVLLELTYLDLILARGHTPAEAAAQLPRLVPYCGDRAPRGSPYPPAGFRFFPARAK